MPIPQIIIHISSPLGDIALNAIYMASFTLIGSFIIAFVAHKLAIRRVRQEQLEAEQTMYKGAIYAEKLSMYRDAFRSFRKVVLTINDHQKYNEADKDAAAYIAKLKDSTIDLLNVLLEYATVLSPEFINKLYMALAPVLHYTKPSDVDSHIGQMDLYIELADIAQRDVGSDKLTKDMDAALRVPYQGGSTRQPHGEKQNDTRTTKAD